MKKSTSPNTTSILVTLIHDVTLFWLVLYFFLLIVDVCIQGFVNAILPLNMIAIIAGFSCVAWSIVWWTHRR